jgi:hypothetical protein
LTRLVSHVSPYPGSADHRHTAPSIDEQSFPSPALGESSNVHLRGNAGFRTRQAPAHPRAGGLAHRSGAAAREHPALSGTPTEGSHGGVSVAVRRLHRRQRGWPVRLEERPSAPTGKEHGLLATRAFGIGPGGHARCRAGGWSLAVRAATRDFAGVLGQSLPWDCLRPAGTAYPPSLPVGGSENPHDHATHLADEASRCRDPP